MTRKCGDLANDSVLAKVPFKRIRVTGGDQSLLNSENATLIHLVLLQRSKSIFSRKLKVKGTFVVTLLFQSTSLPKWVDKISHSICPGFHALSTRSVMIIANPFSGNGRSKRVLKLIRKVLQNCPQLNHEILVTKGKDHALEIVRDKIDCKSVAAVITIGGDGIVHETVNGFMQRAVRVEDDLSFGFLAGGTSNAQATNLYGICSEIEQLAVILRGRTTMMDLLHVTQSVSASSESSSAVKVDIGDPVSIYSHVAVMWGLISDTDFMTDSYRWMGNELKKIFCFLRLVWRLKRYRGKVRDLQSNELLNKSPQNPSLPSEIINLFVLNSAFIASDLQNDAETSSFDGVLTVQLTEYHPAFKRWSLIKMLLDNSAPLSVVGADCIKTFRGLSRIVIEPSLEEKKAAEGEGTQVSYASKDYCLNIDGEKLPLYDRTEISIVPGVLRVFVQN